MIFTSLISIKIKIESRLYCIDLIEGDHLFGVLSCFALYSMYFTLQLALASRNSTRYINELECTVYHCIKHLIKLGRTVVSLFEDAKDCKTIKVWSNDTYIAVFYNMIGVQ